MPFASWLPMRIEPLVGCRKPAIKRRIVVLPQPLGPRSERICPDGTPNETDFTISASPNFLHTRSRLSALPVIDGAAALKLVSPLMPLKGLGPTRAGSPRDASIAKSALSREPLLSSSCCASLVIMALLAHAEHFLDADNHFNDKNECKCDANEQHACSRYGWIDDELHPLIHLERQCHHTGADEKEGHRELVERNNKRQT